MVAPAFGGRRGFCAMPSRAAVTDLTDSGSECGADKVEKTPMKKLSKVLKKRSKRPMKKPSRPGHDTSHSG